MLHVIITYCVAGFSFVALLLWLYIYYKLATIDRKYTLWLHVERQPPVVLKQQPPVHLTTPPEGDHGTTAVGDSVTREWYFAGIPTPKTPK
jgi:hypothetical protein